MIERAALDRLAILPLPDVVVFPGSCLPLHIFEPRYREMTEDVLATNGLMGIVRLADGYEEDYLRRPAIAEIAAIAEIVDSKKLPDGRYALMVEGRERIRIDSELPAKRAYREVVATVLTASAPSSLEQAAVHASQLGALCSRLGTILDSGGNELQELVVSAGDSSELADRLAAVVVEDAVSRQMLLEELDPVVRLEFLVGHVAELVARLVPRSSMPNSPPPATVRGTR